METLYKVIYLGRLKPGASRDHFVQAFSEQFGVSEAQALQLSDSGKEVVIKKNAKRSRAEEYMGVLEQMGMVVRLETMSGEPVGAPPPPEAPSKPPKAPPPPKSAGSSGSPPPHPSPPPENPYAAPSAELYDDIGAGDMTGPLSVPAGHGLRWLTRGWWHVRQNMGAWVGALLLWIIANIILAFIPLLGQLAAALFAPVLTAGFMLGAKEQEEGGDFSIQHLLEGFRQNLSQLLLVGVIYLGGSILIGIAIFAVIFFAVLGGSMAAGTEGDLTNGLFGAGMFLGLLLGMGLLIPLMMAYWFAPALVVLEGMSALAAMKSSFVACFKNLLPFLIYGLVAMVLAFIAVIPFGLGFLLFVPVVFASIYVGYRDIYYGPTHFD